MNEHDLPPNLPDEIKAHLVDWFRVDRQYNGKCTIVIGSYLTDIEIITLALIANNHPIKNIAKMVGRSPKTVEKRCQALRNKLRAHTSVALTHVAIQAGLVVPGKFEK